MYPYREEGDENLDGPITEIPQWGGPLPMEPRDPSAPSEVNEAMTADEFATTPEAAELTDADLEYFQKGEKNSPEAVQARRDAALAKRNLFYRQRTPGGPTRDLSGATATPAQGVSPAQSHRKPGETPAAPVDSGVAALQDAIRQAEATRQGLAAIRGSLAPDRNVSGATLPTSSDLAPQGTPRGQVTGRGVVTPSTDPRMAELDARQARATAYMKRLGTSDEDIRLAQERANRGETVNSLFEPLFALANGGRPGYEQQRAQRRAQLQEPVERAQERRNRVRQNEGAGALDQIGAARADLTREIQDSARRDAIGREYVRGLRDRHQLPISDDQLSRITAADLENGPVRAMVDAALRETERGEDRDLRREENASRLQLTRDLAEARNPSTPASREDIIGLRQSLMRLNPGMTEEQAALEIPDNIGLGAANAMRQRFFSIRGARRGGGGRGGGAGGQSDPMQRANDVETATYMADWSSRNPGATPEQTAEAENAHRSLMYGVAHGGNANQRAIYARAAALPEAEDPQDPDSLTPGRARMVRLVADYHNTMEHTGYVSTNVNLSRAERMMEGMSDAELSEALAATRNATVLAALRANNPRAADLAQTLQSLTNVELKRMSGVAIRPEEYDRLRLAMGTGSLIGPGSLRTGIRNMREGVDATYGNILEGYREAVDYDRRHGPVARPSRPDGVGQAPQQQATFQPVTVRNATTGRSLPLTTQRAYDAWSRDHRGYERVP